MHGNENAESLGISPSDVVLNDRVHIDAMIRREEEVFFVEGTIKTAIRLICNRCAEEFLYDVDTFFHCQEEPLSNENTEADLSLRKRDMDIDHYSDEEVDINRFFREQILLAVPMHPLCKPDCLGLCPKCGQNLNVKKCGCAEEETENPFSVIKKLFD